MNTVIQFFRFLFYRTLPLPKSMEVWYSRDVPEYQVIVLKADPNRVQCFPLKGTALIVKIDTRNFLSFYKKSNTQVYY